MFWWLVIIIAAIVIVWLIAHISKINANFIQIQNQNLSYQAKEKEWLRQIEKWHAAETKLLEVENCNELEERLDRLNKLVDVKMDEIERLSIQAGEKVNQIEELNHQMAALFQRIDATKNIEQQLKIELGELETTLADLSCRKASVLAVEEGIGQAWTFSPGDSNNRLIELIHELVDLYGSQYPVLRKELLKAEWSSVWLPQVQQLCSREGLDRSGIYKITDKENPKIVYIGQAQSIKERWYTHFKKMLGVEAKGTERLYDYRPDEVTWEVVEFKEGNLDAAEKYWIDYYKCREIGLNKKG